MQLSQYKTSRRIFRSSYDYKWRAPAIFATVFTYWNVNSPCGANNHTEKNQITFRSRQSENSQTEPSWQGTTFLEGHTLRERCSTMNRPRTGNRAIMIAILFLLVSSTTLRAEPALAVSFLVSLRRLMVLDQVPLRGCV